MFLSLLTREEKYYFIDLLAIIVAVDGDTTETEKQIINRLKYEIGEDILKYRKSSLSKDKLVDYFSQKPTPTKNIVFMNLISSFLYDEFYSVEEHFLLEDIQNKWAIPNKKKFELMKVVYAERDLRERAKRTISE
ncbi:MAG TPA: hypothetical protein DD618_01135 [Acholeplasmatales bacterium]|nr:hypothetical protein [Acholeplasmatales bacterium]